jgi:hypothetical protein
VGVAVGVDVGVGLGAATQYLAPVFKKPPPSPPQRIIWLPVHAAVWNSRLLGAPVVLVVVQLSVPGSYLAPVFKKLGLAPPQTII